METTSTFTNVTSTVVAQNGVEVGQIVQLANGRFGAVRWVRGNLCGVRCCAAVSNTTARVVASR